MAQENHSKLESLVICQNGSIVRTIEVSWSEKEKACVTEYTKAGVRKVVGRAQNKPFCDKFLNNIRENLEKAGWRCRESKKTYEITPE